MDLKNKKPEDFMYDSSDTEWSEESTSDYWKRIEANVVKKLGLQEIPSPNQKDEKEK